MDFKDVSNNSLWENVGSP